MPTQEIAPHLSVLDGAVNTGVLVSGHKALLFDCCDSVTPERLRKLGVDTVELILCTQHRRPNTAGVYPWLERGAQVIAPAAEQHLFAGVAAYWQSWRNRWHLYHYQPGPTVPVREIPVAHAVAEGDTIAWEGYSIRVLETPGATEGAVSYVVDLPQPEGFGSLSPGLETRASRVCFSGDALYGPGQVWDLYSLQKGFDGLWDYHGFLGGRRQLLPTLERLAVCGADWLIPSHGAPIADPAGACRLTSERLEALWRNYAATSALNYYFPSLLAELKDDPKRIAPLPTREPPPFVRRVAFTSFALLSDDGAALLIDCGHDSVVETLQQWIGRGEIKAVEGCWVTHYHDDHVDCLGRAANAFNCPILTDQHMAEVLTHPRRFFLPCISPNPALGVRATGEGQSWSWHEYRLTAYHFPGQTLYHSGLLVEGHGLKLFFAGDSGAPTGLDDYCAPNRVFTGAGRGSRRCLELWRTLQPDLIFNQHQDQAFALTPADLDLLEARLVEREQILADLLPWPAPDFGLDDSWVRSYPYEQEANPGAPVAVEIQFTNHSAEPIEAAVEPVLPEGWCWNPEAETATVLAPARTDGQTDGFCAHPDASVRVWLAAPEDARPGRYIIPFRITWGGRYLGQLRHAIVEVRQ